MHQEQSDDARRTDAFRTDNVVCDTLILAKHVEVVGFTDPDFRHPRRHPELILWLRLKAILSKPA